MWSISLKTSHKCVQIYSNKNNHEKNKYMPLHYFDSKLYHLVICTYSFIWKVKKLICK